MGDVGLIPAGNEFAVEIHHDQPSLFFLKHNTRVIDMNRKKAYIEKHK